MTVTYAPTLVVKHLHTNDRRDSAEEGPAIANYYSSIHIATSDALTAIDLALLRVV